VSGLGGCAKCIIVYTLRVVMSKRKMSERTHLLLNRLSDALDGRQRTNNRYIFYIYYKDYYIRKFINKLMYHGDKRKALRVLLSALYALKMKLGFQPFFSFRHIVFAQRQLFKIYSVTKRDTVVYKPAMLHRHQQIGYGINHLIRSAKALSTGTTLGFPSCLCVILLNCFIYRHDNAA
jgi:ribosomal protein S7